MEKKLRKKSRELKLKAKVLESEGQKVNLSFPTG